MFEEFLAKVLKIAKVKYEIEEEVTESFIFEIEECYKNQYSPRKTVEVVANHLFG